MFQFQRQMSLPQKSVSQKSFTKPKESAPPVGSVFLSLLFLLTHASYACCGSPTAKQEPKNQSKLERQAETDLGKIPLFYNGRVVSFSKVAKALIFRITSDASFQIKTKDTQTKTSPTRWLLDVISGHERFKEYQIIPASKELLHLAKANSNEPFLSYDQMIGVRKLLISELEKQNKNNVADLVIPNVKLDNRSTMESLSMLELVDRINLFHMTHAAPEQLVRLATNVINHDVPLLAIPPRVDSEWEPFLVAFVLDKKLQTHRTDLQLLQKILSSHRENNQKDFQKAVASYKDLLADKKLASPLTFKTPRGWKEVNNPRGMKLAYFNDFAGFGIPIASFHLGPNYNCMGGLACVVDATGSMERSVNNERFINGLLPLPDKDISKMLRPMKIAGSHALSIEHQHSTKPKSPKSYQAAFKKGNLVWAVSIYGPAKDVENEKQRFIEFANSIEIDNSFFEKLMSKRQRTPNQVPGKQVVLILPTEKQTVVFTFFDSIQRGVSYEKELLKTISALTPQSVNEANSIEELDWKLPENWKLWGANLSIDNFKATVHCDFLKGNASLETQKRIAQLLCGMTGTYEINSKNTMPIAGPFKLNRWELTPAKLHSKD